MIVDSPKIDLPPAAIDRLLVELEVNIESLTECSVSSDSSLSFPRARGTAIHYCISGSGRLVTGNLAPISLTPHTLVILPEMTSFRLETPPLSRLKTKEEDVIGFTRSGSAKSTQAEGIEEPALVAVCGHIRAAYGESIDVFKSLTIPIVERFDETNSLAGNLKSALAELSEQEVGMCAMNAALLKRVMVIILRRSMRSSEIWTERFPILSDPQIARAFVSMLAQPGAAHSVKSLSQIASLSRSAFMARFTNAIGISPLAALRRLRMRKAAGLLATNAYSIDSIANLVGYGSRTSFARAFRTIYGIDPSEYRAENGRHSTMLYSDKPKTLHAAHSSQSEC